MQLWKKFQLQPIFRLQSITVRLTATMLLVSLLPMAGISTYNLVRGLEVLKDSELKNLESIALSTARRLDDRLENSQNMALAISNTPVVQTFLVAPPSQQQEILPNLQSMLLQIKQAHPEYDYISIVSPSGRLLVSSAPELIGQSLTMFPYFQIAMRGQNHISPLLQSRTDRAPGVLFSVPVRRGGGRPFGVVVVKVKAQSIWTIVDQMKQTPSDHAFIVDRDGLIISHSDRHLLYHSLMPLNAVVEQEIIAQGKMGLKSISSLNLPTLTRGILTASQSGYLSYTAHDQQKKIIGFAPLRLQSWIVCLSESEQEFSAPLRQLALQNNFSLLIVAMGTIVVALLLARGITRPVRILTQAAQSLEKDQFSPETLVQEAQRPDDMGQLSRVFLEMAQQVQQREAQLQQQLINLQIEIDQDQRIQQVSEITETEYFQHLRRRAKELRQHH